VFARPVHARSAVGAGDTFIAALSLALAAGANGRVAAEIATAAAAIAIGKDGTSTCSAAELRDCLGPQGKYDQDLQRLVQRVESYREQGRRVVFTNGCFDILHRGHIAYLNRAKALGDVLIVGLNSDASVSRLKGPERPINSLDDRAQVLAALSAVDHIVPFDDDTPIDLIRIVKPDVFVKGGDYTVESLPEAPTVAGMGGEVRILPYIDDQSTSRIIERVRRAERAFIAG
jgi:D-beta-D-heptose 7-phosphate kinase/D-beta-D-heptose 1-phosphate adenosyltransferase